MGKTHRFSRLSVWISPFFELKILIFLRCLTGLLAIVPSLEDLYTSQNRSCGAIGKDSERKQMKINKKVAAIVITAVAISGSATALANASGAKSGLKKVANQIHMKDGLGGMKGGPKGGEFKNSNKEAIVLSTLGIDAATLKSRLEAGESLAAIAGSKKDALIAALVADETKQIDAAVTAGKLTAAQATTLKAGLTAHVTEEVNAVGRIGGMKGGPMGGGFKNANKDAVITATLGIDATTLHNRLAAGESLATIAGAKKDALIAALVADETKQIDAAVTAGKLTADQAATLKSGLTAHVTEEVNEVGHMRGMMDGKHGGKGGHGRGHHDGGKGLPQGSTNGIPSTTTTSAN